MEDNIGYTMIWSADGNSLHLDKGSRDNPQVEIRFSGDCLKLTETEKLEVVESMIRGIRNNPLV